MGSKKLRKKSRQKTRTLRLNRHQWPTLSRRKPPQRSQSQRRTRTTTSTSTTCKKHYFGGTPPRLAMRVCAATTVQLCIAAFWRIFSNWTLKIDRAMYVGIGLTLKCFSGINQSATTSSQRHGSLFSAFQAELFLILLTNKDI